MSEKFSRVCILSFISAVSAFSFGAAENPSAAINLSGWKLQIPGPKEINDPANYSSKYMERKPDGSLVFNLDASEKGHTPNTKYVRSELRHLQNWKVADYHELYGIISVNSTASPDKVTVLQIHGITDDKDNAPPLLRVAVDNGDVYAHIKKDISGDKTEHIRMLAGASTSEFECLVRIENNRMQYPSTVLKK